MSDPTMTPSGPTGVSASQPFSPSNLLPTPLPPASNARQRLVSASSSSIAPASAGVSASPPDAQAWGSPVPSFHHDNNAASSRGSPRQANRVHRYPLQRAGSLDGVLGSNGSSGGGSSSSGGGGGVSAIVSVAPSALEGSTAASPTDRMEELMSKLTTLSSAYQQGRGVAAAAQHASSIGSVGSGTQSHSGGTPPAAAMSLVPHITLGGRHGAGGGGGGGTNTHSKSSHGQTTGNNSSKSSAGISGGANNNNNNNNGSTDRHDGGAGGQLPLRTPPATGVPLVAPAINADEQGISSFNPMAAANAGAGGGGGKMHFERIPQHQQHHQPARSIDDTGNGASSEIELVGGGAAATSTMAMSASRTVAGGAANVASGAFGSSGSTKSTDVKEKQSLLAGTGGGGGGAPPSSSSSSAGSCWGLFGSGHDASHEWEDDATPEHFLWGIFPTRFRREFIAPLVCVFIMLGVAALVAGLLYEQLHGRERDQFSADLQNRCDQRARLIQQNFGTALAAQDGMAGWFRTQQIFYQQEDTWWPDSVWESYFETAKSPRFVDIFVVIPVVMHADRARYERATGSHMTDLSCGNATDITVITDYKQRGISEIPNIPKCTYMSNGTLVSGVMAGGHVRQNYSYYFPYAYKSEEFQSPTPELLRNVDASQLFPAQGVAFNTLVLPIAYGQTIFSDSQNGVADPVNKRIQYGTVSMVPIFKLNTTLSATGNFTQDLRANMPNCLGMIAGVMRSHDAVKQAVDSLEPSPMHLVLWDRGPTLPEPRLFEGKGKFLTESLPKGQDGADRNPKLYALTLNASSEFIYGTRAYRLDCVPTKQQVNDSYSETPILIAAGAAVIVGICITLLLCGWLILNVRRSNSRAALLAEANAGKNVALELLAEAKELADRANKSKSDFLAFLCHELRNPLHAISAMVEFLHHDYFRQSGPGRFTPSQLGGNGDQFGGNNNGQQQQNQNLHGTGSSGSTVGSQTNSPQMASAPDGTLTMIPANSNSNGNGNGLPPRPEQIYHQQQQQHQQMVGVQQHRRGRSSSGLNPSSSHGGTAVSRRRRRVEAAECVTTINTQVSMMRSILDDFLDMSKIESGVLHFEKIGFELALLAKQCVQSMASKCKEKGIRIRLRLNQTSLPRRGYADPTRIKQLILNLLTNACKFTTEGAIELFVEAIPLTHEAAVAAELPAEAFEWAFGESVAMEGASSALGRIGSSAVGNATATGPARLSGGLAAGGALGGAAIKTSRTQPLHTQTRTHALAPINGNTPTRGSSVNVAAADTTAAAAAAVGENEPVVVLVHHMEDGGAAEGAAGVDGHEQKEQLHERNVNAAAAAGPRANRSGAGTPNINGTNPNLLSVPPANSNSNSNVQTPLTDAALLDARPSKIILHISVTDSGSGIAPSALPHLFQPYSQEKLSIMRTHGGTGLGLAIVKNIVAHMHGSIHVTSQQGKGSKFSLHLPIDCRKPGGNGAGGSQGGGDNFDSAEAAAEAELQSTVNRLRALHREEEDEENEDLIESHLLDKFERSFHRGGGGGGNGNGNGNGISGGGGGSDSNGGDTSGGLQTSESDEGGAFGTARGAGMMGSATTGGRLKLSPPLHHAAPPASMFQGGAVAKPIAGGGGNSNWLAGPQLSARSRVAAKQREASSSSNSTSGGGGSGGSNSTSQARGTAGGAHVSSSRSTGGVTFHDDIDLLMAPTSNTGATVAAGSAPAPAASPTAFKPVVSGVVALADAAPSSKTLATHASSMSASAASGTVAVDLLTASSGTNLSSDLLWPAGSSVSAPASAEQRTRHLLNSAPTLSLLLVDDADVNLKILCKMLGTSIVVSGTKYRLHLTTASNGLDAMRKVEEKYAAATAATGNQECFHVILSDIVMPLADGFQFARMLREWESRVRVNPAPLVALTANALKADVDAYSAASFRWFVPKPFRRADLTGVLCTVLQDTLSDPAVLQQQQQAKQHQLSQKHSSSTLQQHHSGGSASNLLSPGAKSSLRHE